MTDFAKLFLKYNYPETKELCLKFITAIISILVFSVTFSDKIINFNTSTISTKYFLITAWILLIISIIFCGIGLIIHTRAGGQAVYGNNDILVKKMSQKAYKIIIVAGATFVIGLIMITVAAILSM